MYKLGDDREIKMRINEYRNYVYLSRIASKMAWGGLDNCCYLRDSFINSLRESPPCPVEIHHFAVGSALRGNYLWVRIQGRKYQLVEVFNSEHRAMLEHLKELDTDGWFFIFNPEADFEGKLSEFEKELENYNVALEKGDIYKKYTPNNKITTNYSDELIKEIKNKYKKEATV